MRQENCGSHDAFKVEINNIKKEIKEIKSDAKENNRYFKEVIDTLKENSVRQTEILKNQEERFSQINSDISGLRNDIRNNDNDSSHMSWLQNFLSDSAGKVLKIFLIVVLGLISANQFGVDIKGIVASFLK